MQEDSSCCWGKKASHVKLKGRWWPASRMHLSPTRPMRSRAAGWLLANSRRLSWLPGASGTDTPSLGAGLGCLFCRDAWWLSSGDKGTRSHHQGEDRPTARGDMAHREHPSRGVLLRHAIVNSRERLVNVYVNLWIMHERELLLINKLCKYSDISHFLNRVWWMPLSRAAVVLRKIDDISQLENIHSAWWPLLRNKRLEKRFYCF